MKYVTIATGVALVLGVVIGAAYGPAIPGIKQVARILPGTKAI